jgi:cation diffusion facilitator family transporter
VAAGIFRPHSHDAADSLDDALSSSQRGIRAVRISFVALMATAVAQLIVVVATGSVALLADTIHNFSDALTAVPLFLAFRLSRRPPNRRYTYGYGRAEDLAGIFVIAMITISAVVAAWEAINRLVHPRELDHVGVLVAAGVIGFVGNEVVALYRIREGHAIGSAALVADGHHARTDGFTSLAVAVGALGVAAGFERADPIVGLVISVAIFAVLRGAARQVYERLMDAVDPALVADVEHQAIHVDGVAGIDDVRVRWVGHRLAAELTIVVPDITVAEGHAIARDVASRLREGVRHLDHAVVHVHPLETQPSPEGGWSRA